MKLNQLSYKADNNLENLPLEILRNRWSEAWGRVPHSRIGRTMMIRSLEFKIDEQELGGINSESQQRLDQLIKSYKRNPDCFEQNQLLLKPGTRLVRDWQGGRYSVLVQNSGYEFKGKIYSSLSQIASEITGTRWNGWIFFGLKKKGAKS